jgi:predicted nucleic-acid-binding protein
MRWWLKRCAFGGSDRGERRRHQHCAEDFRPNGRKAILGGRKAEAAGSKDLLLNPIVLSEFAWTLKRSYKKSRSVIADHLDLLLQSPEFVIPFGVEAADAVRRYREGSADFADYLLAAINRSLGCNSTITFDADAAEGDLFSLLKA